MKPLLPQLPLSVNKRAVIFTLVTEAILFDATLCISLQAIIAFFVAYSNSTVRDLGVIKDAMLRVDHISGAFKRYVHSFLLLCQNTFSA